MPHNEINVRAFVEIADVLPEIPQKEFEEEVKKRLGSGKLSDSVVQIVYSLEEISDEKLINEVCEREWSEEEALSMLKAFRRQHGDFLNPAEERCASPCFDNLQHQLLFEEFEQARKTVKPQVLFELFAKLNRPQLNEKVYLLR